MADSKGLLTKRSSIEKDHCHYVDDGDDCEPLLQVQTGPAALDLPQQDRTFSISGSILIPGVKHMLDNIQQDVLSKLSWYPSFSVACCDLTWFAVA